MDILTVLIFTGAIGFSIYRYYTKGEASIKRRLKKEPSRDIEDFDEGKIGKVVGEVIPDREILIAPLSGRECVFYQIVIKEEEMEGGEGGNTNTILRDEKSTAFYCTDATGLAHIDLKKAKVFLIKDEKRDTKLFRGPDENLQAYLEEHKIDTKLLFNLHRELDCYEGVIEVGEEVTVFGRGYWEHTSDEDFKDRFQLTLRFRDEEGTEVFLSDDPRTFR